MKRILKIKTQFISQKQINGFDELYLKGTIDPIQFQKLVYGPNVQARLNTLKMIKDNPQIHQHYHLTQADRKWQREKSGQIMFQVKNIINMSYEQYLANPNYLSLICSAYVNYDYGYSVKSGVHFFLYLKALYNLGTEMHKQIIVRAVEYQDVGCFALTQLTHGTNVKGIMTQAHYNHTNKQFILHTPSKQGMKFWIGAAANVANMAVVWANLYINQKSYGVHAYVIPIRDKKTHKLLPGVLAGDCGPKTGLNAIDNGFIMFDNFRVPKSCQLNRISGVDQNGKFTSIVEGEQKRFGIHLGALSGGRFMISMNCGILSFTSLAIAIRYTSIRRQFAKDSQSSENLLIDYPLTKRRMMPLLSQAIVYNIGNFDILQEWDKNMENILNPNHPMIQQLHFISSSLKPKSSWFASECIKECRQMMGGHGYSSYSKLGVLNNDNEVNSTWQGDNNVLLQQATKITLDNMQKLMKGKPISSPILKFLQEPPNQQDCAISLQNLKCLKFAMKFLQFKIHDTCQRMALKMMELKQANTALFDIWNNSQVYLGKNIGLMIGDLFYLQTMIKKIDQAKHPANKSVLQAVTKIWLFKIYKQDEFVDSVYHKSIEQEIVRLSEQLSPNSLKLLECLAAGEQVIGSPFANEKGQGMQKYINIVRNVEGNVSRPDWWQSFVSRKM